MATKTPLGEVKRIDARTVWAHEELDFTPWLFENLDRLGEALGLELEGQERECDVGDFAVDIVAREVGSGRVVVIENQLEATDHRHLGQLPTYAAAKQRFRAGFMTTLVAMLGLPPAALSTGIGAQAQKPLAIVVIGGALALALLTRLIQPPLLVLAHRRQGVAHFTEQL